MLATSAAGICHGTPTAARPTTSGGPARHAASTSISVPIPIADSILQRAFGDDRSNRGRGSSRASRADCPAGNRYRDRALDAGAANQIVEVGRSRACTGADAIVELKDELASRGMRLAFGSVAPSWRTRHPPPLTEQAWTYRTDTSRPVLVSTFALLLDPQHLAGSAGHAVVRDVNHAVPVNEH